jgi:GTP cyclohydrolase II
MHVPERVIRPQFTAKSSCVASTKIPTKHGLLTTYVFRSQPSEGVFRSQPSEGVFRSQPSEGVFRSQPSEGVEGVFRSQPSEPADTCEHVALVHGDVKGGRRVPVRVHSECMTGEVFGSLKCDCRDQLDWALAEIVRRGAGAVLYLRQEGRGIGLANKIRAYELQAGGMDTVDANRFLGLPDDARRYDVARDMLEHLGVVSVRLMTNNPDKVAKLRALGISVVGTLPVVVPPNPFSVGYLEAKRVRMAHDLPTYGAALATCPRMDAANESRRAASGDAE